MKVTQFFVGFGQTIWSWTRGETEYGVKALPLGGFVKITGMTALDEVDPADEPRSFRRQPGWQRIIVLAAGSFMHFALAFVLLFILAVGIGVPNTTVVGAISPCLPKNGQGAGQRPSLRGRAADLAGPRGRPEGPRQDPLRRREAGEQLDPARQRDQAPAGRRAGHRGGGPGRAAARP